MGKIVTKNGMRVWVWSNDHLPAHVHVGGADWVITVLIGEAAMLESIKYGRPNSKQIKAALMLVADYMDECNEEWRRNHG